MDRLDAIALFVAAADAGSLAAAARRLGRSPASASRAVAMLETAAGRPLLRRSTRGLRLTDEGEARLMAWREVLRLMGDAREDDGTTGTLNVNAPALFGRHILLPAMAAFVDARPALTVRLHLADEIVDLLAAGVDIAVRLAALRDSDLKAIRIGAVRRLTCAAAIHLDRYGTPSVPADLSACRCIAPDAGTTDQLWPFADAARHRAVRVPATLAVDGMAAAIDAAVAGLGIVRAMSYQVAGHLAAGRLVTILDGFEPTPLPVSVIRGHGAPTPVVRSFVDEVVPGLRATLDAIATALD